MGPGLPAGGAGSAQTPATGWGRDGNGSTGIAGLVGEGRRGDGLGADEGIRGDTGILGSGAGPAWWQRGLWPAAWERRLSGVVGVHAGMKINKNPLQEVNLGALGYPVPSRRVPGSRAQRYSPWHANKCGTSCGVARCRRAGTPASGCWCSGPRTPYTKQMGCSRALGSSRPVEQFNLQK